MKNRTNLLVYLLLLAGSFMFSSLQAQDLTHVKGIHTIGLRGGIGTKNKCDFGLTYNYHFNPKIALSVEADHEMATFGHSDFTNIILVSPGVDYSPVNPWGWSYITLNLAANIGCDKWECKDLNLEKKGFVYGANAGFCWEVFPWSFLSFALKAQEYIVFGNDDQYLKPLFTLGVRYNFHN